MSQRYLPRRGLVALCCWAALSLPAVAQDAWGLDQLLDAAWNSHPAVLGKRSGAEAAQGDLAGAKWQRYPTPSLESSVGRDGGATTLLRVDQPLWTGGRINAAIDAAGRRLEAADAGVMEARHEIGLKVIAAWVEASRQQARQQHVLTAVREHEKLLEMITRRVDQEVSPAVDRNFAQSRLLQAMNDSSAVAQGLGNALTQLSQLAGKPVLRAGGDLGVQPQASRESALAQALLYSPALKRLAAEEAAAVADIDSKNASLWPQVSLRLEKATGALADNRATLLLTAQPGAGLSAAVGIEAAIARREAVRQSREAAVRDVQEQVAIDWDDMTASRLRLDNARQGRAMSVEVSDSYARQYTTGRKTWIDVLNAVRETTQAELAMVDAAAQADAASLRLRLRTGQWLPKNTFNSPSIRQP